MDRQLNDIHMEKENDVRQRKLLIEREENKAKLKRIILDETVKIRSRQSSAKQSRIINTAGKMSIPEVFCKVML